MDESLVAGRRIRARHLTSVHSVLDNRITYRECGSLQRAGHDVALVAAQEATGPVDGVRVITVGRGRHRLDRATRGAWRVARAAHRERPDVYHLHDPELLWVGLLLKLAGGRVVYDVHEDAPRQIRNKFWVPWWARTILAGGTELLERVAGAVFDGVVAATPAVAERFPRERTVVVQNFPSPAAARPEHAPADTSRAPGSEAPPAYAFAYTGGVTAVQGAREIVATAAALPGALGGAVVAGWFDDDDLERELRQAPGWQAVDFRGRVAPAAVLELIRSARCGLVIDHPISNYLESWSTKMFEYMACGVPVVCSDFPLWTRLVHDADCGVVVDPRDPDAVAAAVARLAADPDEARRLGANGRAAVLERYNWDRQFAELTGLYRRIVEESSPRPADPATGRGSARGRRGNPLRRRGAER